MHSSILQKLINLPVDLACLSLKSDQKWQAAVAACEGLKTLQLSPAVIPEKKRKKKHKEIKRANIPPHGGGRWCKKAALRDFRASGKMQSHVNGNPTFWQQRSEKHLTRRLFLRGYKSRGLLTGRTDRLQDSSALEATGEGGNVARNRIPTVPFPLGNETANWRWERLSAAHFSDGYGYESPYPPPELTHIQ